MVEAAAVVIEVAPSLEDILFDGCQTAVSSASLPMSWLPAEA